MHFSFDTDCPNCLVSFSSYSLVRLVGMESNEMVPRENHKLQWENMKPHEGKHKTPKMAGWTNIT